VAYLEYEYRRCQDEGRMLTLYCIQVRKDYGSATARLDNCRASLSACIAASRTYLGIAGIEVTQAIQYFEFNRKGTGGYASRNTVPLVANKLTILRVYVDRSTFPDRPIPSTVTGVVNYPDHPELTPINAAPIPAKDADLIDRGNANDTLNFLVPASHCLGTVPFTATVFEPGHRSEPAYSSDAPFKVAGSFEPIPPLRIRATLIRYPGMGMDLLPPGGEDLDRDVSDLTRRLFPISDVEYTYFTTGVFDGDLTVRGGVLNCGPGWESILAELWILRAWSNTSDIWVGLFPAGTPVGAAGCGAWVWPQPARETPQRWRTNSATPLDVCTPPAPNRHRCFQCRSELSYI
jgi:hypothetical protein